MYEVYVHFCVRYPTSRNNIQLQYIWGKNQVKIKGIRKFQGNPRLMLKHPPYNSNAHFTQP